MAISLESALLGEPYDASKKIDAVQLYNALVAHFVTGTVADYYRDDLTDLNAISGEVSGERGVVLNDGTASNNGIYTTDGTTWTKEADLPPGFEALSLATVATTGDSDDLSEGSTQLLLTVAERAAISSATSHASNTSNPHSVTAAQIGVESGADVTDAGNVEAAITSVAQAAAANTGDSDRYVMLLNSASLDMKTITRANLLSSLTKAIAALTGITIADADNFVVADSSASDVPKRITWANLKAAMKTYTDTLYATTAQGTKADGALLAANDLSDLASASTARTNLGLGTVATTAASAYATAAQGALADSAMQSIGAGDVDTTELADGGVTTAKLAADAVDGTKVADAAISEEHLDAGLIAAFAASQINSLTSVGGTGSAYTATGPDSATISGTFSVFTPATTCTADTPTLNIGSEGDRDIVARTGNVGTGGLVANVPYLIQRVGTSYRVWSRDVGVNTVRLTSVTSSDGLTYTASASSRAVVSLNTLVVFYPDVDNEGAVDMVIDSVSYDVLTDDFQQLAAGTMQANGAYLGLVAGSGIRLIGVRNPTFEIRDELQTSARDLARINSSELALLGTGSRTNDTIRLDGTREHWIASYADCGHMIYATTSGCSVDVINLRAGYDGGIMIRAKSGGSAACEIFTSYTTSYTLAAGDAVRVYRDDDEFFFETVSGSAPTYDGAATYPTVDYTIITAWQSIAERFGDGGGAHGLQMGWKDWSLGTHKDTLLVDGAVGGTGLVPYADATTYWWDPSTSGPGPSATAWKAALDAIPSGQPDPVILIIGGQTDASVMGEDATTAIAAWKTSLEELIYWMRSQIDGASPDTVPVYLAKLGAKDSAVSPSDAQYAAINWIMQEIIDAQTYTYEAGPWWDLPRGYFDSHLGWDSSAILGYRIAGAIDNAQFSGTNGVGPTVSGITEMDSGLRYRISIASDTVSGVSLVKPDTPDGFALFASGEDPLSDDPLEIDYMEWASGNNLDIYLKTASAGATVMFPYGVADYGRLGRYIRNLLPTPVNKGLGNTMPLKAFKSGAF